MLTRQLRPAGHLPRIRSSKGFTLVELMIGILVGTIVVAGVIALYITVIRGSAFVVTEARVTQDTRISMDLMASDIRRAGYSHPSRIEVSEESGTPENPFMDETRNITIHDHDGGSANCILVSYDPTFQYDPQDASLEFDLSDLTGFRQFVFGYRLNSEGVIQILASSNVSNTESCETGSWETLTDRGTIRVNSLTFSTEGSTCLNTSLDLSSDSGNTEDDAFWEADEESRTFCEGAYNGALESDRDNVLIESRQVRVTLEAADRSSGNTQVTFDESIRVRNNRIFTVEAN
ncbi:prepilin-type N-terminal cleavage/methylation domain-containing protein [Thioalkalivibrio thiocyanoxidans]|uniref:prepilin-type N-terminal cleavage/methylation domain-containing protein n=1 Tax=Thioalkalivibrio thiocyanoxidans TaxID=152475 RepID=UPI00036DC690|nr:prepilin-type N-terminal cleavage/methylation domain-containing protein [Thioalkalivibrio thiocyanoxidans]